MKIDISFVPDRFISSKVKEMLEWEVEYPYTDEDLHGRNFIRTKRSDFKDTPMSDIRTERKKNYLILEKELMKIACKLKKADEYQLSEQLFKYLVEIGSKLAKPKEELLKYYLESNNKRCLKWIIQRIDNQLKTDHLLKENKHLIKVKDELLKNEN